MAQIVSKFDCKYFGNENNEYYQYFFECSGIDEFGNFSYINSFDNDFLKTSRIYFNGYNKKSLSKQFKAKGVKANSLMVSVSLSGRLIKEQPDKIYIDFLDEESKSVYENLKIKNKLGFRVDFKYIYCPKKYSCFFAREAKNFEELKEKFFEKMEGVSYGL